ncbi:glycosyl transferase family protein [Vibrio sp. S9_S30]|nr:glycosyl transferase family protein [Vibrio sp. S9_S30]
MSIAIQCIKALGKGERGRRSLTEQESFDLMRGWFDGHVADDQLAMALVLMRVNNETPEEIAGFVRAFHEGVEPIQADLDWPLYAGKRVHENKTTDKPWHLVAAKILADNGHKILLHGHAQRHLTKNHAEQSLDAIGIVKAQNLQHAEKVIQSEGIAYLPLEAFQPKIVTLLSWNARYGVRTPINTVVRALNPGQLPYGLRGSFHPGFQELHAKVEQKVSAESGRVLSFKGTSGETEFNPKVSQTVWVCDHGKVDPVYWEESASQPVNVATQCVLGTASADLELMSHSVVATLVSALFAIDGDKDKAQLLANEYWSQYLESVYLSKKFNHER